MLQIRRFRSSDAPLVAKILKKTAMQHYSGSSPQGQLNWRVNIVAPQTETGRSFNYLGRNLYRPRVRNKLMVVEDKGKIVGVMRKSRGKIGNLYLQEKYYRRGAGSSLINSFEQSCLRQINNKPVFKKPLRSISVLPSKLSLPKSRHNAPSVKAHPIMRKIPPIK